MNTPEEKPPIIFTHCGQLGDFIYTWPIAAWWHRTHGQKVWWVLPRAFGPFTRIERLLRLQTFTAGMALVDYRVQNYGHGGQPYKFDPWPYLKEELEPRGSAALPPETPVFNLGMRSYPTKWMTNFVGEEYNLGWDPDWVLKWELKWEGKATGSQEEVAANPLWTTQNLNDRAEAFRFGRECGDIYTEHLNFPKDKCRIDLDKDVWWNLSAMAYTAGRHSWFSSIAVMLYFARLPFTLYREDGHPSLDIYFPDRSRYKLVTLPHGVHPSWRA